MKYSDDIIQRVKDSTDIVAVVGEHVKLKKAGASYKGLCPFHNEKTPSFIVSPSRNSFHCFGCGKGGNAITFIMEMEKISFPETLRLLADKAGIVLPKLESNIEDQEVGRQRERMIQINEFASRFFQERLLSSDGLVAREYFKKRGFAKEDALKFLIGYAPPGWDNLKNAGQKERFSQEELLQAGLIVHNEENKSFYDKFRNRLIFPVKNNYDKIIAFGGRTLNDDTEPKYLNSPETLLFKKGENLYLLDKAREAIRRKGCVLLVEGYFDALALHHHGFENTVATLGTALTQQHGRILKRYTLNVVFSYDADDAGQAAILRGWEPLLSAGLNVKVLVMPDSKDPDEFLRRHPKQEFSFLLENAPDFARWWADSIKRKTPNAAVEERLRKFQEFVPFILQMPSEASIQAACAAVGSAWVLDNRDLLTIVNAERKKGKSELGRGQSEPQVLKGGNKSGSNSELESIDSRIESDFLSLLTEAEGDFIPWAKDELSPEVFTRENFRRLFEQLCAGEIPVSSLGRLPELTGSFIRLEILPGKRIRAAMLADLASALQKNYLKRRMEELKILQSEAEKVGDMNKSLELAQKLVALKKQFSQEVELK